MAQVYLAIQQGFERQVALKVILPELATNAEFGRRFLREARIVGGLTHPHIISVYDVGEHQGTYYLAMELLDAGDLRERMRSPMEEHVALEITRQVAAALGFAHQKGFVHRDIKPDNILFRESGEAVVTDFGIARPSVAESELTEITQVRSVIGSPKYMSPEQSEGEQLDGRSDIYSLGVLLYQMLAGELPFPGRTLAEISRQRMQSQPPRLPETLQHLQPLVDGMLAYDRDKRFADCGELLAAIEALTGKSGGRAAVTQADSEQATLVEPEGAPDSARRRRRAWLIAIALVSSLAIGLTWLLPWRSAPPPAETGTPGAVEPAAATGEVRTGLPVTPGEIQPQDLTTPEPGEFFAFYDAVNSGLDELERSYTEQYPRSLFSDILQVKLSGDPALLEVFLTAAERGSARAQVVASELLDTGWGGQVNQARALELAAEAAAGGNPFADYHYAMLRLARASTDSQRRGALEILERSAESGFFLAQTMLANYLLEGRLLGQDIARGLELLQSAGEQKDRNALFNLAQILDGGLYGQRADPDRARRYFEQAAALGHPGARSYLREP